jgi:chemosensory pili system protein ChpE
VIALFATAFLLGLVFNAAPGSVFAETVRHVVRGGYRPALQVQIGSLVGDALWAVLGLVGIGLPLQLDILRVPVGIAGVVYLLWLARDSWRAAEQEFALSEAEAGDANSALRAGALLSITNPQNIAYWAALGSAMGAVGVHEPTPMHYGVFFAGFMVSSIVWSFICAGALALLFRKTNTAWAKTTYRLCALAFLALACMSLRDLWHERHAVQSARPGHMSSL